MFDGLPLSRYDSWKTEEPEPDQETHGGGSTLKSNPPAAGFCVFCGAGLNKEEAKSAPMRCYRCAGSYSATIATGTEIPSARFCWRCGDRYDEGRCPRCEMGLTNEMVWQKAQEWQVSMADAKAMLLRGEEPEIPPDDDLHF